MAEKMVEKGYVCRESGFTTQGRREVEIGTRLLGNDKNNVIVDKVLSYFWSLSSSYFLSLYSKFKVFVTYFGTK